MICESAPVGRWDALACQPRIDPLPHLLDAERARFRNKTLGDRTSAAAVDDDLLMGSHTQTLAFLSHRVNRTSSDYVDSGFDMTPGERLREKRRERGLSAAQLAARVERSESAVRNQENGTNGIPADLAALYARALGTSPEWILYGREAEADEHATESVAVVGYVGAGSVATLFAEGQGPFDYVMPPADGTPKTVALNVKGTSLGPAFDESIIFYDDVRSPVTPDLHGRLCVVGLLDGRVLVKILKNAGDGTYHLFSNTMDEPMLNEPVAWAARVKGVRPR